MTYRDGQFLFADEQAAYEYFLSSNSRETWGTMTMEEWRTAGKDQWIQWDEWCAIHRPAPLPSPTVPGKEE